MTLALARGHAAPAFNGLFYGTVATAIPVLFLAVAIQGRTYQNLLDLYTDQMRAYRERMYAARAAGQLTIRQALAGALAATPMLAVRICCSTASLVRHVRAAAAHVRGRCPATPPAPPAEVSRPSAVIHLHHS